ncbi:GNAT family N-acetyltransferase [Macrococcus bovicus]|uniref:GNAT family N-acetyltransferase n=1 Tax=Macrococcus bovicus TaxID=69968 RepID=UPI0025A60C26|nr:GNAT family N-acetyltransferase [Macrococcus bovicus]WJP97842.1 GNAT family N-acetyltransferase [Macrococcus bovicus]
MFSYKVDDEIKLALPLPEKDGKMIYRLISDNRAYLNEFLPWPDYMKSSEDEIKFLQNSLTEFAAGKGLVLVIRYQEEIVGLIDFHAINPANSSAEIGYWLTEDAQGKGIMTRAVQGMIELGFDYFDFNRLTLVIQVENKASQKVAERSGFEVEGKMKDYIKEKSEFRDAYLYALIKAK